MVHVTRSCVLHDFLNGVATRDFWLFGMREGGFGRASKAVKQLDTTCTVAA